jgi:hypothetical protein
MLHTLQFLKGNAINRQQYSHETGSFKMPNKIEMHRIAIFEGLHSFFLFYQKELFDLKIYMRPDEELRVLWKMKRDVGERGYTEEKVLQSITSRKKDAEDFVEQQEKAADIIIAYHKKNDAIQLHFQCLNHFYLDDIIESLIKEGVSIQHAYVDQWQYLLIDGTITKIKLETIAEGYNDALEDLGFGQVHWMEDYDGIIQILIVQIVFYKMQLLAATNSEGIN